MGAQSPQWYWFEGHGGRVLIGPGSLLLGRGPDCDVVLSDERVSRHFALFRLTEDGVEVIPVGRQPVVVNGVAHAAQRPLAAGDRVECFGHTFTIVAGPPPPRAEPARAWGIERSRGALFRVAQTPFRVGGAADDHLHVVGWPASVFLLHRVGDALALEACCVGVSCPDALVAGACVHLESGARITYDSQTLRVVALPTDPASVTAATGREDPLAAELRFLPRGGRLTLRFASGERSVYLPDRRCDLLACLLQPPPPYAPGDVVPDEALLERIWPDGSQGRVEINTLVFRVRKDLIKADIDGAALLAREAGGVRLRLAPGAPATVVTA